MQCGLDANEDQGVVKKPRKIGSQWRSKWEKLCACMRRGAVVSLLHAMDWTGSSVAFSLSHAHRIAVAAHAYAN